MCSVFNSFSDNPRLRVASLLSSPPSFLPVLLTFVVYGTLGYQQYKKLQALPSQPFKVLAEANAAAPAQADSTSAATEETKKKE